MYTAYKACLQLQADVVPYRRSMPNQTRPKPGNGKAITGFNDATQGSYYVPPWWPN